MKPLDEIKVSFYQNVFSKKPQEMSFLEIISRCIRPVYASDINTIRRFYEEGDHEAAQKLKSKLPCFTPAGTFDGAHAIKNFLRASHIIGLDYDHVSNRINILRLCSADSHTVAAIESPTDGVKIFAYVEGIEGHHREGQQLVSRYYDALLGLQSDPACKDESRLCYCTYSPNGYIASLYTAFTLKPDASSLKTSPEQSETEIKQFLSSYIFLNPLTHGQRHTNLFKLACEACRRGYPQESVLREIDAFFPQSDFPEQELKSVLSSGYQKVDSSKPNNVHSTPDTRQKDKRSKGQYDPIYNYDDGDEAYWQGEEFRKKTPLFPRNMYNNLPNLLDECLIEDEGDRGKDISFLADLVALSAVLPHTFGIYNHKKYSTHLFGVIISPAGSGKSITLTGRYLLEEIHHLILAESNHKQKTYHSEYTQWKAACSYSKKQHEPYPEEPEKPTFKILIIPATTSYTRMQIQMQDNGLQGSIIFDTEAQSLSTANQLDCGNFDDMLRKAFEHEDIDSSYKVNGIAPISVHHPQLALFLTGTPGQVEGLLNSSENGLASRIIYYTYREAPHWKEMGDDSISLEESFKPLAHRAFELYHFCLEHPVLFHFTRLQWNRLNETFSQLLSEVALEGNDDLQAVVKRYAFLVMRISMIQTRIRQFESADTSSEISCSDIDFERSLQLVLCCYEHSRLLLSSMSSSSARPLNNPNSIRDFIADLPESFTTEEAVKIGAIHEFSERKTTRLLKKLNGLKISKVSHGSYTKI